jgi:hypothetical protein
MLWATHFKIVFHIIHVVWWWQSLRLLFDYQGREDNLKLAWLDIWPGVSGPVFKGCDYKNREIKIDFHACDRDDTNSWTWYSYNEGIVNFFPDYTMAKYGDFAMNC